MNNFLESQIRLFQYYKSLADKSIAVLTDEQLSFSLNENSNSIHVIMHHLSGNMLSRWTDFLTTDGEKSWRNRDSEFEVQIDIEAVKNRWEVGWKCLFDTLNDLTVMDLDKIVYIRNQGQTVMDAINRQVAHYAYHIGQIVYLAKYLRNEEWVSLSIPKNKSKDYNYEKFSLEKNRTNFTDEFLI